MTRPGRAGVVETVLDCDRYPAQILGDRDLAGRDVEIDLIEYRGRTVRPRGHKPVVRVGRPIFADPKWATVYLIESGHQTIHLNIVRDDDTHECICLAGHGFSA